MSEVFTGVQEEGSNLIIRHSQDISAILNANEETRKYTDEIWNGNHSIKPAATLDMVTLMELQKNGIMQYKDLFFQWLERNPQFKVVNKTFARNRQIFSTKG